jgi:tetratricopeptide (TPR) repeat protein
MTALEANVGGACWTPASAHPNAAYGGVGMVHETSGVRHSLQLADYLIQCGDRARAAEIYIRLAAAYAERRRTPEAAAICHRVLHVDASQFIDVAVASTLRHLGRAGVPICAQAAELHRQAGRHGDAVRLLALAVELDPADALAPVRVAEALLEQHDYRGAVAALTDAGARLLRDGNNADYLAVAEQILAIDPRHVPTLRELARTHVRIGEPHRAVDLLARLMKVQAEDPAGYEILAQAFATIGRMPKSLSILTRLVHDLRRAGNEPAAQQMLDRARWWSADEGFQGGVGALREPSRLRLAATQAPAREATVMLSIADITIEEERDLEGTLVLALDDIAFVQASRRNARPASEIGGRIAAKVNAAARARGKTPPPPPPAKKRAPLPPLPVTRAATSSSTIVLDLSDLLEDEMATVLDAYPIRDSEMRRLAELALDEDSGAREARGDDETTVVRKRPVDARARVPAPLPSPPIVARTVAPLPGAPRRAPKAPTVPIRTGDRARPGERSTPPGRPPSPTRGRSDKRGR